MSSCSISLKEKALEESRFQVKQLEDQNTRFKARVSSAEFTLVTSNIL